MRESRDKNQELSQADKDLIDSFLQVEDFETYLLRYPQFCRLKSIPSVFAHQMKLMERDETYTHREKDKLLAKRKNELIRQYKKELSDCISLIEREGFWDLEALEAFKESGQEIAVTYTYPGKRADAVKNALALRCADRLHSEGDIHTVYMSPDDYEEIALMTFSFHCFSDERREDSQAESFLFRFNRAAQADALIERLRFYCDDYRSLRSMKDLSAKRMMEAYQRRLNEGRDAIWQQLLLLDKEAGRWQSEEKVFKLVYASYPDAVYQYKPRWLNGQSLDVYIPSLKAAIEYQGLQHYQALDYFGGKDALLDNKKRDMKKRLRCEANGIRLVYWAFFEPVTEQYFQTVIRKELELP